MPDNIKLLDCTLRDGMYITDFHTDDAVKRPVIKALETAGIDIIECGFLKRGKSEANSAVYGSLDELKPFIECKKPNVMYAAIVMEIDNAPDFPVRTSNGLDCIRIAFFKNDADAAIELAKRVKEKGYDVLVQPMRTSDYSDTEIRELIGKINTIKPFGMAVVDSNGNMLPNELTNLANIYRECLEPSICAGFHFHNNSQLAFANAISAIDIMQGRELVIDCSIFGMGRGAGNLPTELIAGYLNKGGADYDVNAVFDTYDKYFAETFKITPWGYSLKHLLSANYNANPYFATFMSDKYNLNTNELSRAFASMTVTERMSFNPAVAEKAARSVKQ